MSGVAQGFGSWMEAWGSSSPPTTAAEADSFNEIKNPQNMVMSEALVGTPCIGTIYIGAHCVVAEASQWRTWRLVVGPLGVQGDRMAPSCASTAASSMLDVNGSAVSPQRTAVGSMPNNWAALSPNIPAFTESVSGGYW